MKLKYYMRGLGIGILITTIILSFGGKKEKLSEKEIMAKARALGMVMKEESDDKQLEKVLEKSLDKEDSELDDVNEDNNIVDIEDPSEEEPVVDDLESSEKEPVVDVQVPSEDEQVPSEKNTGIDYSEPSENDTDIDIPEPSDDESDVEIQEPPDDESDVDIRKSSDDESDLEIQESSQISFTIVRGMSSRQVSELLFEKGLVENAVDFDDYIKRQGKASVIRIGTYTLPEKSDYQVILSAIAG